MSVSMGEKPRHKGWSRERIWDAKGLIPFIQANSNWSAPINANRGEQPRTEANRCEYSPARLGLGSPVFAAVRCFSTGDLVWSSRLPRRGSDYPKP